MSNSLTILDIARGALAQLRRDGWIRGKARSVTSNKVCLGQAMMDAAGDNISFVGANSPIGKAQRAVLTVVREQWPDEAERLSWDASIPTFNDSSRRRFADIEMVLEKVIAREEEKI